MSTPHLKHLITKVLILWISIFTCSSNSILSGKGTVQVKQISSSYLLYIPDARYNITGKQVYTYVDYYIGSKDDVDKRLRGGLKEYTKSPAYQLFGGFHVAWYSTIVWGSRSFSYLSVNEYLGYSIIIKNAADLSQEYEDEQNMCKLPKMTERKIWEFTNLTCYKVPVTPSTTVTEDIGKISTAGIVAAVLSPCLVILSAILIIACVRYRRQKRKCENATNDNITENLEDTSTQTQSVSNPRTIISVSSPPVAIDHTRRHVTFAANLSPQTNSNLPPTYHDIVFDDKSSELPSYEDVVRTFPFMASS